MAQKARWSQRLSDGPSTKSPSGGWRCAAEDREIAPSQHKGSHNPDPNQDLAARWRDGSFRLGGFLFRGPFELDDVRHDLALLWRCVHHASCHDRTATTSLASACFSRACQMPNRTCRSQYLAPILPDVDRREAEPKGAQLDMRGVLTIFRNKAFIAFVMPSLGLTSK